MISTRNTVEYVTFVLGCLTFWHWMWPSGGDGLTAAFVAATALLAVAVWYMLRRESEECAAQTVVVEEARPAPCDACARLVLYERFVRQTVDAARAACVPVDGKPTLAQAAQAVAALVGERDRLLGAIKYHHAQHADDLCWQDDAALYAAAGLPPRDCRVGDKEAMLRNCERFVELRCKVGGPWLTYEELEKRLAGTEADRDRLERELVGCRAGRLVEAGAETLASAPGAESGPGGPDAPTHCAGCLRACPGLDPTGEGHLCPSCRDLLDGRTYGR